MFLLEALGENLFHALSSFWRPSLAHGSCPWRVPTSASVIVSPSLTVISSLPYKDPCDYQIIQDNLSISRSLTTSVKSLFPCKVRHSQVLGIRTWASLRGHYNAFRSQSVTVFTYRSPCPACKKPPWLPCLSHPF